MVVWNSTPTPLCSRVKGSHLSGLGTGLTLWPLETGVKGAMLIPVSREPHHSQRTHSLTQRVYNQTLSLPLPSQSLPQGSQNVSSNLTLLTGHQQG